MPDVKQHYDTTRDVNNIVKKDSDAVEVAKTIQAVTGVVSGIAQYAEKIAEKRQKAKNRKKAKEALARASQHEAAGNRTAHINSLMHAIDLDADLAEAHNALAWTLALYDKELDVALVHAKVATQLEPESAEYLDTLAEVHFARKEYEEAASLSVESFNVSGKKPRFHYLSNHRIGRVSLKRKEYQDAVNALSECINSETIDNYFDLATSYYYLALALKELGNVEQATICANNANQLRSHPVFAQLVAEME